jgi:threonine dehydrogenase-like Zn-dependent dehydrogenase
MTTAPATMTGVVLPGNSTVEFKQFPVPKPGPRQVLVKMKASSICGSDIRAIYRAHLGKGPEGYQPGTIAGHEPCGQIVEVGPDCKEFKVGDRVILYHISGCGCCDDCKQGYMISCHNESRAAYGWQRNGGHAPFLLAEENTCVHLPDNLTYLDGALVACGALGAREIIGVDTSADRLALGKKLGLIDHEVISNAGALDEVLKITQGKGCEASIDCSGAGPARALALKGTRQWGRVAFVGEGNDVKFDVSPDLIHPQITIYGSWVTSLGHMSELTERLARWNIHPEITVTHKFPLEKAAEAYDVADKGQSGKVAIVFE